MHAADGNQTGSEYWLHQTRTWLPSTCTVSPSFATTAVDIFCPKSGMAIQAVTSDGYTARYTTNGPDQCVSFMALSSIAAIGAKRNWKFTVAPGPGFGNVTALFSQCKITEKGYTAPFLSSGSHYAVIMPPVVFVGQVFWITVVVLEQVGTTKTDYNGTTTFTSTDPGAKIQSTAMDSYNFTWDGCGTNCGVKIFINVSFTTLGIQTVVAVDTLDGSIAGVGTTMVVAADIKLEKRKKLTVAASGDTVQFLVCWSNYSTATGFTFVVTDAVPNGTTYFPEAASVSLCSWNGPAAPSITMAYSTATSSTPPAVFTTLAPAGLAPGTTRWLRWTVRDVYVNSSGCLCYKVSVN
jgi:uncharacterized repeat protein (TIGR01451 family)